MLSHSKKLEGAIRTSLTASIILLFVASQSLASTNQITYYVLPVIQLVSWGSRSMNKILQNCVWMGGGG